MKQQIKKIMSACLIVVLTLSIVVPTLAFATAAPNTYSYSIGAGQTEWSGAKNSCFWETNGNKVKWFANVTDSQIKTITAYLYRYDWSVLNPDKLICSKQLTGSSGQYVEHIFTPEASKSYYTKIKTNEPNGVNGRTTMFYY